jgi:hypothetical protein
MGAGQRKNYPTQSICWEDLSFNESLKLQRKLADFSHLGIYVRFPDHVSASMSYGAGKNLFPNAASPEFEYYRFFTLAVELICLERTFEACHQLRLLNSLTFKPSQELRIVEEAVDEFPELGNFTGVKPRTS